MRANAIAICDIAEEKGSMGVWLTKWKSEQPVELWDQLSKQFSQLGGNSAPYFLRMVGKDSFTITPFVLAALNHWAIYNGTGKDKREHAKMQEIFQRFGHRQ